MLRTLISGFFFSTLLGYLSPANASRSSYHLAHPVGWMHQMPTGETPGWSSRFWTNFEINHANVWNKEFTMTDKRNGNVYKYTADFEQSSAILELGAQVAPRLAMAIEVPYAYRNGGYFDDFIDQFHQAIGSNRFLRHLNDKFSNEFVIEKNGVTQIASGHGEGVGSMKFKTKAWIWQNFSETPGACDCGLSVGAQVKIPMKANKSGMSSGSNDYTGALYFGVPLFKESAFYAAAAFTKLGSNQIFREWPKREWQQMFEASLDWSIGKTWGLIMQTRFESPMFNKGHVTFEYDSDEKKSQNAERIASGWNSLMQWRGSQSIGPRWRWGSGHEVNLLLIEDWGIGRYDGRGDVLYVNNAPDVSLVSQIHIVF